MKQSVENVLIAGVGGQGVILVSEILSETCMAMGFDVKKSEVHGMAQRGGSVVSHVRYGPKIRSPLIEKGTADVLVAFEELEALRWSPHLKPDGLIIVNQQEIRPMPVAVGLQEYPSKIMARLRKRSAHVVVIDGPLIAQQVGSVRAVNVALLGALAAFLGLDPARIRRLLRSKLPPRTVKANLAAFAKGWKLLKEELKPQTGIIGKKEHAK
jgi:indolepyruvate ferredoxin oxidoreductase beta subunit